MIGEPRWSAHPVTKPGYGEPEPLKPVFCYDPPENMAKCLDCPVLPDCNTKSKKCLLNKRGGRRAATANRDDKVRDLIHADWRNDEAICEELHISRWMLQDAKRRLRERGEIK